MDLNQQNAIGVKLCNH